MVLRCDNALAITVSMVVGGLMPYAPLTTAFGAIVVLSLLTATRALSARVAIVSAACLVLGWWRASNLLVATEEEIETRRIALGTIVRCEAKGRIVSAPTARAGRLSAVVVATEGSCDGASPAWPMRVSLFGLEDGAARDDELAMTFDVGPIHRFDNPGTSDVRPRIARGAATSGSLVAFDTITRGGSLASFVDHLRAHIRARVNETYHPRATGLGRALVLGESDLESADSEAFQSTGLAHLLAVSGTHLIIAVMSIASALRAILARVRFVALRVEPGRVSAILAIPMTWFYAELAGGTGSVYRAAGMATAAFLTEILARRPRVVRTLSASLLLGWLSDPLLALDVSFALSFAAAAALVVSSRLGANTAFARRNVVVRLVLTSLLASGAATLACAPILASLSGRIPVIGLFANVIAAPVGEVVALPFCLLHAALGFWPAAEQGAAFVGSGALLVLCSIAHVSAASEIVLPVPPPTAAELATLAIGIVGALTRARWAPRVAVALVGGAAFVVLECFVRRDAKPLGELRVTVLDVAQGDAVLVDLPDGEAVLIDAGGLVGSSVDTGGRVVLPVLRHKRRDRLAALVLSHPHPDHYGGLASVMKSVDFDAYWDTGENGANERFRSLAEARGGRVMGPSDLCDRAMNHGGARIEVLAPCPSVDPARETNDNSFVIRISYGRRAVLLMGDAEEEEERLLLESGRSIQADFLKVGHHGSATSTSAELLHAVRPGHAAISCGARNRFGHPRRVTLDALSTASVFTRRTDEEGAITWSTDGDRVWWSSERVGRAGAPTHDVATTPILALPTP